MQNRMENFCRMLDRMTKRELETARGVMRERYARFVARDRPGEDDEAAWNCVLAMMEIEKRICSADAEHHFRSN
jgi:hypothetical protein